MKRIVYLAGILATLLAAGCGKIIRNELIDIQNEIDLLHQQVRQMNTDLGTVSGVVRAMEDGGYVTGVSDFTEDGRSGYTLTFNNGNTLKLYSGVDGRNGEDGHTPVIAIRQDETDGLWYWTLDGEWITGDGGERFKASGADGVTPTVKVEEGQWWVSMDEGATWTPFGNARGEDAVELFTAIDLSDPEAVVLTLADGSTLSLPRYLVLTLTLSLPEEENGISAGETLPVRYTVSGSVSGQVQVSAGTDGRYKTRLERISETEGTVYVTCPDPYTDGYIYVVANDGLGHSVVRVVNFYERVLELSEGLSYTVEAAGGTLAFPVTANFAYAVVVAEEAKDWVRPAETQTEGTLSLSVDENTLPQERTALLYLCPTDHPEYISATVTLVQAAAPEPEPETGGTGDETGGSANETAGEETAAL